MMTVTVIGSGLLLLCVFAFLLARRFPAHQVEDTIVAGPFRILAEPFEAILELCNIIRVRTRQLMRNILTSLGISGEHWIQRVVGTVLLAPVALLMFGLDFLLAKETLAGSLGGSNQSQLLGMSLEDVSGAALVCAILIWGALLLDLAGQTHITVFSSQSLPRWLRISLTSLVACGTLLCIWFLVELGALRFEILRDSSTDDASAHVEHTQPEELLLLNPSHADPHTSGEVAVTDTTAFEPTPHRIPGASRLRTILAGVPIVTGLAGLVASVTLVPAVGLLITGPFFLIIELINGIVGGVLRLLRRIIDVAYTAMLNVIRLFIQLARPLNTQVAGSSDRTPTPGRRGADSTDRSSAQRSTETEIQAGATPEPSGSGIRPQSEHVDSPEPSTVQVSTSSDDAINWNPLNL